MAVPTGRASPTLVPPVDGWGTPALSSPAHPLCILSPTLGPPHLTSVPRSSEQKPPQPPSTASPLYLPTVRLPTMCPDVTSTTAETLVV